MGTWGRGPLPSAHRIEWTLSRLPPPPGSGHFPLRPTEERLTSAVTWGGIQSGRVWDPPLQRGGNRWVPVQAPLKRGLSPPKAVTGGFSSPAGAAERDGGRNPPPRLRRATSLFKGGFWGWRATKDTGPCIGGCVECDDSARPADGEQHPQSHAPEPMARSTEVAGVSVKCGELRFPPQPSSSTENLRSPPHRPAWWYVPGQARPAGAEAAILRPSQAPVGRKGDRRALRSPRAGRDRQAHSTGLPSPVMGVLRGSGA